MIHGAWVWQWQYQRPVDQESGPGNDSDTPISDFECDQICSLSVTSGFGTPRGRRGPGSHRRTSRVRSNG